MRAFAVALPTGAKFVAVPDGRAGMAFIQSDGWIRTKVGWFTARRERVTSRRVDHKSRSLRAQIGPLSYSSTGSFYPSLLYFPSLGCWRITAVDGSAHLSAIVEVAR